MGYKKSFNLVTIQLIIPLSTMTKAEYKNAFGIDLDDIEIEKVTLLQDEGSKNKYFVDEIKTTESGIDIYAGGKVLSIGSSVAVVENAYSVINSKPLYWHSLTLSRIDTGALKYYFDFIIINNDENEFDFDSFMAWLQENSSAEIKVVQGYFANKASNLISSFRYGDSSTIVVSSVDLTTGEIDATSVLSTEASGAVLTDAVNKFN